MANWNKNVHKEGEEVEENWNRNRGEDCNGNGSGNEEEKAYVHGGCGWSRTTTRLSKKSLEMCTEGLGSESGSDMGDDMCLEVDDDFASAHTAVRSKGKRRIRDAASATTFPPPLTSGSGSGSA
ncbi:protein FANTASTIC FOUR 2, partial [Momordica charantia]|uniref:Protein FANTASTIC FOUR 2 n=1 Tax=Momordica charantia TaxID=3673 RepID=A0A6J1DPY7_MOMCH